MKSDYAIKEETNVEYRTLGCDLTKEVDLKLEKVLGSPCAKLKFIFNGFKVGPRKCTFKYQDVRIYRTLDGNIKNFNSSGDPTYPNERAVFYSTLDGNYIFTKSYGDDNLIKVPTLLNNNANTPFEFTIEPNFTITARIYVCYYAQLDCEGTLCSIGPICFTDYIPCL